MRPFCREMDGWIQKGMKRGAEGECCGGQGKKNGRKELDEVFLNAEVGSRPW